MKATLGTNGNILPDGDVTPNHETVSISTPPTEDRDWKEEIDGYESTQEDGYKLFHIPERDLMTIINAVEARGYREGRESRQSEIDFLREEAYGDKPLS